MRYDLFIRKIAAENIQRGTDSVVNFSPALFFNQTDIIKVADTTGINAVNRRVARKNIKQFTVNTAAFALNIHSVNEKLTAAVSQLPESLFPDNKIRKFLPAVGDDKVVIPAFAAR